jgi:hypothetical protein
MPPVGTPVLQCRNWQTCSFLCRDFRSERALVQFPNMICKHRTSTNFSEVCYEDRHDTNPQPVPPHESRPRQRHISADANTLPWPAHESLLRSANTRITITAPANTRITACAKTQITADTTVQDSDHCLAKAGLLSDRGTGALLRPTHDYCLDKTHIAAWAIPFSPVKFFFSRVPNSHLFCC